MRALVLALCLAAPGMALAAPAPAVTEQDVAKFYQMTGGHPPEGIIWKTFHDDFPAESRALAVEALARMKAGKFDEGMSGAQQQLRQFILSNTYMVSKAPDAALIRYAAASAKALEAARAKSVEACAARVNGAGAALVEGGPVYVEQQLATLDGIKAARETPTVHAAPDGDDGRLLLEGIKAAGASEAELALMGQHVDMNTQPPAMQCDVSLHMMAGIAHMPAPAGARMMAMILGLAKPAA